jgi:hypothetical protein
MKVIPESDNKNNKQNNNKTEEEIKNADDKEKIIDKSGWAQLWVIVDI